MLEFRFRAEEVWSRLAAHAEAGRLLIVSHGGMINMLYRAFLGLPVGVEGWVDTGDTGMHLWRVDGTQRDILFTNRLAHLDASGGAATPTVP
jgi:2,3-bisphosphoglycerate-dependent phosphoglycerate mutase